MLAYLSVVIYSFYLKLNSEQQSLFDIWNVRNNAQGIQHKNIFLAKHGNYATNMSSGEKRKKAPDTVFQELPDKYFDKAIAHSKIGNKSYIQSEQAFYDGQGFKNLRGLWTACPDSQFENSPIKDSYGPLEKKITLQIPEE